MEKKRWLWKRKSSDKSPGETESSGSVASHSERCSDEQEALRESPNRSNQSPDVTSKAVACTEEANHSPSAGAESPEVTSKAVTSPDNVNDDSPEEEGNNAKNDIDSVKEVDVNDGLRNLSEKLSAALVNVSAKDDLVKQHAKVAEEAIAGWEKAENEVAVLKKQIEAANLRNSTLEDRVSHLDGALKECVRQLRQTRDEQEKNIHDAVVKQTYDLEVAKLKLENQLLELQSKLDAADSRSPDLDLYQKVERLQKENTTLKHKLQAQSEELEIMTIERDLSTQAAETASKQHLETIKKVTKLEAECRRLKTLSCRASLVNDQKTVSASSFSVESLTDSLSDSGERFNAVDIDTNKSGSEPNKSDPTCSDSWASALIAELDQFKNEKSRQPPASCVKIDLMDDFLEMERLAALTETKNESINQELVETNQCVNEENSLIAELNFMSHQMSELKDRLEKVEAEKAELEMALVKSEDCIQVSQLKLRAAEIKMHELQRERDVVNKLKQMMENQLKSMEAEAETISAKFDSLESEVDKEKALSAEIAIKYEELEQELESKRQQEILRSTASSYSEMKIKQEDLALAAGKLAECQKTIASLGNQLQSLATLEDFLIDTASIPGFSASPSLVARTGGDTWKLHSNDTFLPKRDSASSSTADGSIAPSANKKEENSPPSSTLSSALPPNHVSSEKSRNGFAKFFSRTKSGIRLEI
ncbi:hypothetical protein L6164_016191 [Bauhinia variegata]|uniref:Uncharacterized protein n=1 Tax=Bauhinia variegata TaxID=167791 RepID=A0ACB9NP74_BAUVA|nr:hypothetical protein L6164_016191 [Bauhinia variegata]